MDATVQLSFEVGDSSFHFYFPDAELASSARTLFIACVRGQTDPECELFGAELAFGEILGNVARHAPGPVEIHFFLGGSRGTVGSLGSRDRLRVGRISRRLARRIAPRAILGFAVHRAVTSRASRYPDRYLGSAFDSTSRSARAPRTGPLRASDAIKKPTLHD
jgi:hypothetical protein